MEYIEGETLAARIRRGGPLGGNEAIETFKQICAGITEAHSQGLLHRDLKTSNIMLERSSDGGTRAVIMDFGLARFTHRNSDMVPPWWKAT